MKGNCSEYVFGKWDVTRIGPTGGSEEALLRATSHLSKDLRANDPANWKQENKIENNLRPLGVGWSKGVNKVHERKRKTPRVNLRASCIRSKWALIIETTCKSAPHRFTDIRWLKVTSVPYSPGVYHKKIKRMRFHNLFPDHVNSLQILL